MVPGMMRGMYGRRREGWRTRIRMVPGMMSGMSGRRRDGWRTKIRRAPALMAYAKEVVPARDGWRTKIRIGTWRRRRANQ